MDFTCKKRIFCIKVNFIYIYIHIIGDHSWDLINKTFFIYSSKFQNSIILFWTRIYPSSWYYSVSKVRLKSYWVWAFFMMNFYTIVYSNKSKYRISWNRITTITKTVSKRFLFFSKNKFIKFFCNLIISFIYYFFCLFYTSFKKFNKALL